MDYKEISYQEILEKFKEHSKINLVCTFDLTREDMYSILPLIKDYFSQALNKLNIQYSKKKFFDKDDIIYNLFFLSTPVKQFSYQEFIIFYEMINQAVYVVKQTVPNYIDIFTIPKLSFDSNNNEVHLMIRSNNRPWNLYKKLSLGDELYVWQNKQSNTAELVVVDYINHGFVHFEDYDTISKQQFLNKYFSRFISKSQDSEYPMIVIDHVDFYKRCLHTTIDKYELDNSTGIENILQ